MTQQMPCKTRARAMEILTCHLQRIGRDHADVVQAVVLTGSLVTGSYTGDAGSDIDLIHVLRSDAPQGARQAVMDSIACTEQETGRDLPISRCVYRLQELYPPYPVDFALCPENKDYIELPVELLRMKDAARVVWGELDLQQIPAPTRENLIAYQELSARWVRQMTDAGVPLPPRDHLPLRLMVQSVLVHALLDVFYATGRSCSSKAEVAGRLREEVPAYAFLPLVEACTRWRYAPRAFTAADEQLIHAIGPRWEEARRQLPPGGVPMLTAD